MEKLRKKKRDYPKLFFIFLIFSLLPFKNLYSEFSLSGYYKTIFFSSETIETSESYYLCLHRLRIKFLTNKDNWQANITFDNEILLNDFSSTSDFDIIRQKDQKRLAFWDLDYVSGDRKHTFIRHLLYRAYLKYNTSCLSLTLGKQAINFSRMRFFSGFYLFNPTNLLDLEKDEQEAVDALNLEYYFSANAFFNLVYIPYKNREKSSSCIRIFKRAGNYDLYFVGGIFKKDELIGFGLDGYIKDAGVRTEITYSYLDNHKNFPRLAIGIDYSPTPHLYLLAEYFYNGGADDNNPLLFLSSYEYVEKTLSLKKHLLSFFLQYKITPLLNLENYLTYDFEGKSVYLNPEIRYNIFTNLDVSLGAQLFWGGKTSEFGNYKNLYYTQLKWFF